MPGFRRIPQESSPWCAPGPPTQTQPRWNPPAAVAVQYRRAISSCEGRSCGHTTQTANARSPASVVAISGFTSVLGIAVSSSLWRSVETLDAVDVVAVRRGLPVIVLHPALSVYVVSSRKCDSRGVVMTTSAPVRPAARAVVGPHRTHSPRVAWSNRLIFS